MISNSHASPRRSFWNGGLGGHRPGRFPGSFMLALLLGLFMMGLTPGSAVAQEETVASILETMPERPQTCRLGWLPSDWVAPLEPYGINESIMVVGLGTVLVGTGSVVWNMVTWTSAAMVGTVMAALWVLHLPLEMAILGVGGIAAWEGAQQWLGQTDTAGAETAPVDTTAPTATP